MGAYRETKPHPHVPKADKVVIGASGFTGLWALTWMGTEALAVTAAVQGGFAVGSVMAGSGLTLLWWRTRTLRALGAGPPAEAKGDGTAEPETA